MEKVVRLSQGISTRVFDTGGEGDVVVLVHGLGHSIEIWHRVIPMLARFFRVVAFDMPGFGMSDHPDAQYDGPFFARCLLDVLDALALDRAHLVGSSLGATAIVHMSGIASRRIDRVVLAAPGGFDRRVHPVMRLVGVPLIGGMLCWPTPVANRLTLAIAFEDTEVITPDLRSTIDRYLALPGAGRAFTRALRAGVGIMGGREVHVVRGLAASLDRPVLLVWGGGDRVFPIAAGSVAASLIRDSRLHVIPRCGHYPQWERFEAFTEAVVNFLI